MSKHPLYNTTGLQINNKSHVLYALTNKQMELQQLQEEYNKKISKVKNDLIALKSTICLFDDDCDETIAKTVNSGSNVKKKRNSYFERGEIRKLILKVIRTTVEPLKTNEIAILCQELKGISTNNIEDNKFIQKIVVETLRDIEKKNLVEVVGKDGLSLIWKIKN